MKKLLACTLGAFTVFTTLPYGAAAAWNKIPLETSYLIEIEDLSLVSGDIGAIYRATQFAGLAVRSEDELSAQMQIGDINAYLFTVDQPDQNEINYEAAAAESAAYYIYTYDFWMQRMQDAVAEYHEPYYEVEGVLPKETVLDTKYIDTSDLYVVFCRGTLPAQNESDSNYDVMAKALQQDGRFNYVGEACEVRQLPAYLDGTVTAVCESAEAAANLAETLSQYYCVQDGQKVYFYRLYDSDANYALYTQAFDSVAEARSFCDMLLEQEGVTDASCDYYVLEIVSEARGEIILPSDSQTVNELGDIDKNGKVDTIDAKLALQEYANTILGSNILTAEERMRADVTNDGTIDSSDAILILRYYNRATIFGEVDLTFEQLMNES
ncbi:MAG: dockerin type I repeat-containing protein [Oscillospiraceae bacterium]